MTTMYGSGQKVNGRAGATSSYPPQHAQEPPPPPPHQQQQQQENNNTEQNVSFNCSIDKLKQKERIITVRYGAHQMKLIRKRLAVEGWLDEQLRMLYRCELETDDYDTEIDLDEVLDLDTEQEQFHFIQEKVANSNQRPEVTHKFIMDVIAKANTL